MYQESQKLSTTVLSNQVLQSDNILANEHELEPNVALKYCWSFLYCCLSNHERTKINKLTVKEMFFKTIYYRFTSAQVVVPLSTYPCVGLGACRGCILKPKILIKQI